jgi:molecular chaperone DnaK
MPMVKNMMKKISGTTPNKMLSPDQSIAHGATYYAGMLLTNDKFARSILNERATERLAQFKQRSVSARSLGILIRDAHQAQRVPHYLIPANSTLPASQTQRYGTVVPNQRRVNLQIVESGTSKDAPPVKLGECIINDLPPNLPEGSEIDVTIRYDAAARVHVEAVAVSSGKKAAVEIIRQENVVAQLAADHVKEQSEELKALTKAAPNTLPPAKPRQETKAAVERPVAAGKTQRTEPQSKPAGPKLRAIPAPPQLNPPQPPVKELEETDEPIPLDEHGRPLEITRLSETYGVSNPNKSKPARPSKSTRPMTAQAAGPSVPAPPRDEEIMELDVDPQTGKRRPPAPPASKPRTPGTRPNPQRQPAQRSAPPPAPPSKKTSKEGEDEFWGLVE